MYRKYFVYIDDGEDFYKIAIAADSQRSAAAMCEGNGDVIAVVDVTDDFPISIDNVRNALKAAGFQKFEMDFICRVLTEFSVAE